MNIENVVLVTIDALSFPRLGAAGYRPSPSPTIDRLMAEGLTLTRAYTVGSPTQFAMPGVHTSTLPLDAGGYEMGIRERGAALAESFSRAGYQTVSVHGSAYFSRLYGYDRGFDTFHSLVPVVTAMDVLQIYLKCYGPLLQQGAVSLDHCTQRIEAVLPEILAEQRALCADRAAELDHGDVPLSPLLHNWDFPRLVELLDLEERWLRRDPRAYVWEVLTRQNGFRARLESVARDWVAPLPLQELQAGHRRLDAPFGPYFGAVSGAYLLDRFEHWLDSASQAPFFASLHLLDVHELNFLSTDAPGSAEGRLEAELRRAEAMRARLLAEGARGWAQYAYAIGYVDRQLQRLLDSLEARGLRDKTLVVLCADHGWCHGIPEERPWDVVGFFEENLHVPLVFNGPGVPARQDDGLCSLLDLAPTLLDLAGLPIPDSFRGESLLRRAGPREHVLMDHLGRGPCDFAVKPIRIGVRSATYKVMCSVPPQESGEEAFVTGVYDLLADPSELHNLMHHTPYPPEVERLLATAEQRAVEIFATLDGIAAGAPGTDPAELDLDQVLARLADHGHDAVAFPAIERAIADLMSVVGSDGTGFELEDLLAALRGADGDEVARWIEQVVAELQDAGPAR